MRHFDHRTELGLLRCEPQLASRQTATQHMHIHTCMFTATQRYGPLTPAAVAVRASATLNAMASRAGLVSDSTGHRGLSAEREDDEDTPTVLRGKHAVHPGGEQCWEEAGRQPGLWFSTVDLVSATRLAVSCKPVRLEGQL